MQKLHGSTGDWNFFNANWILDTVDYIVAPSSIRFTVGNCYAILKHTASGAVNQGIIDTYIKARAAGGAGYTVAHLYIRHQSPDGLPFTNIGWYRLNFTTASATLYRYPVGGPLTTVGAFAGSLPNLTWKRVRFIWWEGKNLLNEDATCFRLLLWDGAAWIQAGTDLYDTQRLFWNSPTARVGIGDTIGTSPYTPSRFDETYILAYP
jgi:hypothetical protein